MLHHINNNIWKTLFGKPADGIEQSIDDENEYRIIDSTPFTNKFLSHSSNAEQLNSRPINDTIDSNSSNKKMSKVDITASLGPNCANFIAGIIEGILNSSGMTCKCSAHFVPEEEGDEAIG